MLSELQDSINSDDETFDLDKKQKEQEESKKEEEGKDASDLDSDKLGSIKRLRSIRKSPRKSNARRRTGFLRKSMQSTKFIRDSLIKMTTGQ